MGILPASVFVYHVHAWCPEGVVVVVMVEDALELKLQSVWGTGDGTQVLWTSSQ